MSETHGGATMTDAERAEMLATMRQTRIRFVKTCDKATEAIREFIAAWDERRNVIYTADIRRGTAD